MSADHEDWYRISREEAASRAAWLGASDSLPEILPELARISTEPEPLASATEGSYGAHAD